MTNEDSILLERLREEASHTSLMDDDYVRIFFDDNLPAIEFVLRIITGKKDLQVIRSSVQQEFSGPEGSPSVRFDVYAVDSKGTQYDIEVQKRSSGATPRRVKRYAAFLDISSVKDYEDPLTVDDRENFVIFITQHDIFKKGLPLYKVERVIMETGEQFNDGTHIIYVNTAHKDYSTELGKLIHDFRCMKISDMYYPILAERASSVMTKKEARYMKVFDELRAKTLARGRAEGKAEEREKIAQSFIRAGSVALDVIAENCQLPLQRVQELAATLQA